MTDNVTVHGQLGAQSTIQFLALEGHAHGRGLGSVLGCFR